VSKPKWSSQQNSKENSGAKNTMGAQKITRIKISAKFELVNQSLSLSLGAPSLSNHSLGNCSLLFWQCPELRNAIVVPLDDNPNTGCNCKLLRGCNCCPLFPGDRCAISGTYSALTADLKRAGVFRSTGISRPRPG
jgi:hypothetical protein